MAKYLLLKHYRGGPEPVWDFGGSMDRWAPDEVDAHMQFISDLAESLTESGEFVDSQALSPGGTFVRYGDTGQAPVTDGPFAETKDVIAGWMLVDVESQERAHQIAAELSSAPGPGGRPLQEWIEVRAFLSPPRSVE